MGARSRNHHFDAIAHCERGPSTGLGARPGNRGYGGVQRDGLCADPKAVVQSILDTLESSPGETSEDEAS
jgi:hypothetical protein